ncbi:S-layer homology domain-containing protein [Patescibacteria group bacterium]|nr:S-layer homology domain-containing protein [Patescibacteria group bacterium]
MAGYVLKTDILGNQTCVSGDSACYDQLGFNSSYRAYDNKCVCDRGYINQNSRCVSLDQLCKNQLGLNSSYNVLSDTCECSIGYIIRNDQCVQADDACEDKIGRHSKFNSLTDKCECDSGYVLSQKSYGSELECRSCTDKHGIHAEYDYLSKECECESDYTMDDDGQCIEKQNNVYFDLIELDDDNNEAIIRSDYDRSYYHVSYGLGCLSIWRYENRQIVINLGTDYSLDTWDKIVLQDDDQTCNIVSKERVDSGFSLEEEEEETGGYYVPTSVNVFEVDIALSPYRQAIENLKNKGVVGGYPDGTYKPKNLINRAEFIKIVMGAAGFPASGSSCYSDVKDEWFAGYACAAKSSEIATGYPDGTFKPTNNINVVEALKIVLKTFVISVRGLDEDEEWFKPYVETAQSHSLYLPTFDSADKKITREEMAELVNRILDLQSKLSP